MISNELRGIITLLCKIIKQRRLIKFYYESDTSGRKGWRTVRPYMVIPIGVNIQVVGTPVGEINKILNKRQPGHYLISKLIKEKIVILSETFKDPGVPREIVVNTKSRVICRFIYDNEKGEEVMPEWIKLDEL